jgi:DNA-binding beta-propeller fold protein YncE
MNLAIAGNELYVADYWNDRIEVFGLDGSPHRSIGRAGKGSGEFGSPGGVAVSVEGDLYVADFYGQRVQHLTADGQFIEQWGNTGEIGVASGLFNYPTDVALGSDGSLYIADGYNDRIQVFGADGKFVRKWGGPFGMNIFGPFNGWFATVTSITLDTQGNLYVADFYNNRVQKFSVDGQFLTSLGQKGTGPGQFQYAIAVAVAGDGAVFIADFANNRIQKWQPKR